MALDPRALDPRPAVLDGASSIPFWLDQLDRPVVRPPLAGNESADLVVVGGGFTGLWAALIALEEQPGREVVLLEGKRLAWAATGRNGGFCAASLTHGLGNGAARWPGELKQLSELGLENLAAIEAAVARYEIDCGFVRGGELDVAVEPWQLADLAEVHELAESVGEDSQLLDAEQTKALTNSPTYLGARLDRSAVALVDPARLAWGLARAIESLGGRVHESTVVTGIVKQGDELLVRTATGAVTTRQAVLGTSAFRSPLKRLRPYVVPVWDHVLMTEPLTTAQRQALGWQNQHGISDSGNRFHYYRLTEDGRLLFGGYDALYYFGNGLDPRRERNERTEALLAQHLVETFPVLAGIKITHTWGGAIDTCSQFSAFWHLSHHRKVASVQGFTGLGVGASRFGVQVCLDLLAGRENARTRLQMVRKKPLPFPPEPIKWLGIQLTRRAIARSDSQGGRRGWWLRTLDRLGLGFDS